MKTMTKIVLVIAGFISAFVGASLAAYLDDLATSQFQAQSGGVGAGGGVFFFIGLSNEPGPLFSSVSGKILEFILYFRDRVGFNGTDGRGVHDGGQDFKYEYPFIVGVFLLFCPASSIWDRCFRFWVHSLCVHQPYSTIPLAIVDRGGDRGGFVPLYRGSFINLAQLCLSLIGKKSVPTTVNKDGGRAGPSESGGDSFL